MTVSVPENLSAELALIFRITHIRNVPWILEHGLHCESSRVRDPDFVSIGSEDVIPKRAVREVPTPPGGALPDYVPFYFTPRTPMLYNIKTGSGQGVVRRPMSEIVVLVSSLHRLRDQAVAFVFTDRHALRRPPGSRRTSQIWIGSAGVTCGTASLLGTQTTRASSSSTKPRLWHITRYHLRPFSESLASTSRHEEQS